MKIAFLISIALGCLGIGLMVWAEKSPRTNPDSALAYAIFGAGFFSVGIVIGAGDLLVLVVRSLWP